MNILITNIGRKVYLVEFLKDLLINKIKIKIFLADNNLNAAALNLRNIKKIKIPKVTQGSKNYIKEIFKIVNKNQIDILIPCTNFDLKILSSYSDKFKKKNCHVIVSSLKVITTCLNKKKLNTFCNKNNFLTPKIYSDVKSLSYFSKKLFMKKKVNGHSSLTNQVKKKISKSDFEKNYLIQDFIEGQEYHLDILNDKYGNYITSCAKKKIKMLNGETEIAQYVSNPMFYHLAQKLSKALKHIGNIDCDLIMSKKNKIFIIDINPRFGGGYPFTHKMGFNFLEIYLNRMLNENFQKKIIINKKIFSKGLCVV